MKIDENVSYLLLSTTSLASRK